MNLVLGVMALLLLASLAGQWYLWRRLRGLGQGRVARETEQEAHIQRLADDLAALCRASAGAGDHLIKLEQQLRRVMDRQDQWELRSGSERSYQQAIQMVQHGADAGELVRNCGLTPGEADLIVMLHGMARTGTG
jgi:hypothetical protein